MNTDLLSGALVAQLAAAGLYFMAVSAQGQEAPRRGPDPIKAALQPFVETHALAGAVMLVADKDHVLSLTAVAIPI